MLRIRSAAVGVLVLATVLGSIVDGGPHDARADETSPLVGSWTNLAADGGRAAIETEVDRAIAPLFSLVRTIARRRILENNPPIGRLEIRIEGGRIHLDLDHGRVTRTTANEWTSARSRNGDAIRVRARVVSPTSLKLEQRAAEGGSRTLIRLEPNGTLVQDVTIDADQLPDTIHYTLRYRKQGA